MSDDGYLGYALCCIPRRLFVLLLSATILASALTELCYVVIFRWLRGAMQLTPTHCSGPQCQEVVTCGAMIEATSHVRLAVWLIGGAFFGYLGLVGSLCNHPGDTRWFGLFLFAKAILAVAYLFADWGYTTICEAYPYNIISEAVLWLLPDWPIQDGIKREVAVMRTYPVDFVDRLTRVNIWALYIVGGLLTTAFWLYCAHTAFLLAHYSSEGVFGLGANHSIRGWRDQVLFKYDVLQHFKSPLDLLEEPAGKSRVARPSPGYDAVQSA